MVGAGAKIVDAPADDHNESRPKSLDRYFRKTISTPEGAILHYGDCSIYCRSGVCDCGLLRALMPLDNPEKWYGSYYEQIDRHLEGTKK